MTCLWDLNGSGGVSVSDALLDLNGSVGLTIDYECPPCETTTTTLGECPPAGGLHNLLFIEKYTCVQAFTAQPSQCVDLNVPDTIRFVHQAAASTKCVTCRTTASC